MKGDFDPTTAQPLFERPTGDRLMPASARNRRRRAAGETFTALLSCKPIDVCLRRLKYEALRKHKAKR